MTEVPDGLQSRGAALWQALGHELDSPAGAVALEACRTVDRLDELDRIIAGKGVLNLMQFRLGFDLTLEDGSRAISVKVEMSNVLAEARQQSMALKQLLVTLGIGQAKPAGDEEASPLARILQLVAGANAAPGSA